MNNNLNFVNIVDNYVHEWRKANEIKATVRTYFGL